MVIMAQRVCASRWKWQGLRVKLLFIAPVTLLFLWIIAGGSSPKAALGGVQTNSAADALIYSGAHKGAESLPDSSESSFDLKEDTLGLLTVENEPWEGTFERLLKSSERSYVFHVPQGLLKRDQVQPELKGRLPLLLCFHGMSRLEMPSFLCCYNDAFLVGVCGHT